MFLIDEKLVGLKDKVVVSPGAKVLAGPADDDPTGRNIGSVLPSPDEPPQKYGDILFDQDGAGNLIITEEIVLNVASNTYNRRLAHRSRSSEWEAVKEAMKILDTEPFYSLSQNPHGKTLRFVYEPWLERYSAEEVNYLGVGMGFAHFDIFLSSVLVAESMVATWNLVRYGHGSSSGEKRWGRHGFNLYKARFE